jgi:4-amino-4-deoxy-L-arabinose transferase-like glycosyltransferase
VIALETTDNMRGNLNLFIKRATFGGTLGLIIIGIYLQTVDIEKNSFFIDELYHVYAAKSFNETHTFSLPSGRSYTRASIYTVLVSLSFKMFGISEFSARLPSVLCGLLYLILFYYIIKKLFNNKIALTSTIMLMFSAMQIHYTKDCRMYSLLQLTYLSMAYFFYKIFNSWVPEAGIQKSGSVKFFSLPKLLYITLFSLTAWVSYSLHLLSLLFLPSALFFITLVGIEVINKRKTEGQTKTNILILGSFVVIAIAVYLLRSPLNDLYGQYHFTADWSKGRSDDFLFYLRVIKKETLLLWLLVPIGAAISICQFGRPAMYTLSLYAIPFLLLSALPQKTSRYLYHIYPLSFVFISVSVLTLYEKVVAKVYYNRFFKKDIMLGIWQLLIAILIGFNLFSSRSVRSSYLTEKPDWKQVGFIMRGMINKDDIVITDNPISTQYYLGRADYAIDENLLQISKLKKTKSPRGQWLDFYTNAVHITNIHELETVENGDKKVWIFLGHKGRGFKEIIQYIRKTHKTVDGKLNDKRIRVYQRKN